MADQQIPETLLKPKQAEEILQLSRGQIYRLVRQGYLPAVIIGRSVRFRACQLAEFINQHNKNIQAVRSEY